MKTFWAQVHISNLKVGDVFVDVDKQGRHHRCVVVSIRRSLKPGHSSPMTDAVGAMLVKDVSSEPNPEAEVLRYHPSVIVTALLAEEVDCG